MSGRAVLLAEATIDFGTQCPLAQSQLRFVGDKSLISSSFRDLGPSTTPGDSWVA